MATEGTGRGAPLRRVRERRPQPQRGRGEATPRCSPNELAAGGRGRRRGHGPPIFEIPGREGRGDQGESLHEFNRGMDRSGARHGPWTSGDHHGQNGAKLHHSAIKGEEGLQEGEREGAVCARELGCSFIGLGRGQRPRWLDGNGGVTCSMLPRRDDEQCVDGVARDALDDGGRGRG